MADSQPSRRRVLLGLAAGAAAGGLAAGGGLRAWRVLRQPRARVGVHRVTAYDDDLPRRLGEALAAFPAALARARGGRVVLKPNMVEVIPGRPVNTDPRFLAALAEAFRRAGAAEVVVAEGPGHLRDTEFIVRSTGLDARLREVGARFVDLNVDATEEVALPRNFTGLGRLRLPRTVLGADLLVSVAKMKTHHWVGATLTMKNLFGTVPGAVYGWPKNVLHWAGIDRSIVDLWLALRPGLGVVDGIVAMEGDGPIMGTPRPAGVVVLGEDLAAVDATTARLMGFRAEALSYLAVAARLGGTVSASRIDRHGDDVPPARFAVREAHRAWQG